MVQNAKKSISKLIDSLLSTRRRDSRRTWQMEFEELESRVVPSAVLVKDITSNTFDSNPTQLTDVNGTLFFRANDGNGNDLWKTDGTAEGTVKVRDFNNGALNIFIRLGDLLIFVANDGSSGAELWRSDGTAAGTTLVKDINPGSAISNPSNLCVVGGVLYFAATSPGIGSELWRSDGTSAGTFLVKDILPLGGFGSNPASLTNVNGTLFFAANDGISGTELWKSDGTTAGTVLMKDR